MGMYASWVIPALLRHILAPEVSFRARMEEEGEEGASNHQVVCRFLPHKSHPREADPGEVRVPGLGQSGHCFLNSLVYPKGWEQC